MSAEVQRTEIGHWPAGVSGNPGGYSKEKRMGIARLSELARTHTEAALNTIIAIMNDEKAPRTTRLAASNAVLDRAWGKPAQSLGLSFEDEPGGASAERSPFEVARTIAFLLASGAREQEQKQRERETATDAELSGASNGDG